jgi:hypothetical protein
MLNSVRITAISPWIVRHRRRVAADHRANRRAA